uniref:Arylacetamide deacetylase-like 4 n=1 Tax=Lates calcarifer TaxID=8187 RepID=A0A4W6EEE1_LATCA
MVHGLFVGIAIVVSIYIVYGIVGAYYFMFPGRILHRLGICHQVSFIRWFVACFLTRSNPVPAGLRVKDLKFSEVPVRVYEPTAVCDGLRRGLVYFHGGGWVLDSVDEVCRHIAKKSDTIVVSVGYRLAPEHRYPAQLDDCETATCHFLSVAEAEFSVDSRRVAVGGDSTGANLAAALCQRLCSSSLQVYCSPKTKKPPQKSINKTCFIPKMKSNPRIQSLETIFGTTLTI